MASKRILVTGANGQLGRSLRHVVENYSGISGVYCFRDHDSLDITDMDSVEKAFDECGPVDIVINCAAYTDVNKAETDAENAEKVNYAGVVNLVKACKKHGAFLIQISTDYVFDGIDRNMPYSCHSDTNPLNVYGKTKERAERYILNNSKLNALIIRTSWLFSEYGKNFYTTIRDRILNGEESKVINDRYGAPTYAVDLAEFIVYIIENENYGRHGKICHYTNGGIASWYDFAIAINQYIGLGKILNEKVSLGEYKVLPISSINYGEKVYKPRYSALYIEGLDRYGVKYNRHWTDALCDCIEKDLFGK